MKEGKSIKSMDIFGKGYENRETMEKTNENKSHE